MIRKLRTMPKTVIQVILQFYEFFLIKQEKIYFQCPLKYQINTNAVDRRTFQNS